MAAAFGPRYDLMRFGVVARSSPRQSDILLVNGWVTKKLRPNLRRLYEEMAEPKWVIAMGECAILVAHGMMLTMSYREWTLSFPLTFTYLDALQGQRP